MNPLVIPFLTYAVVTTFTPGPNNITSTAIGMRLGYRRTIPYILGIMAGFLVIMLAAGVLTDIASRAYRGVLPYLKWIGVIYMCWLAVSLFLPSAHGAESAQVRNAGFRSGLLLQIVNPKVILYGITIYSSFHVLLAETPMKLIGSSIFLAVLGGIATSLWAVCGNLMAGFLKGRAATLVFNITMALLLLYSAVSILLH
jgi:cysteine/O-acetylserine efflux protein